MPKNWVWPVTEGNWAVLAKKNVWATYSDKAKAKVQPGDRIAFYVKGTGNFRGIHRLSSDWYSATEPTWYDEIAANEIIYKHQVRIEPLELVSANYKSLVHSLAFVKNKAQFQVYVQSMGGGPANHGRPITDEDLEVLAAELEHYPPSAKGGPVVEAAAKPNPEPYAPACASTAPPSGVASLDVPRPRREPGQVHRGRGPRPDPHGPRVPPPRQPHVTPTRVPVRSWRHTNARPSTDCRWSSSRYTRGDGPAAGHDLL